MEKTIFKIAKYLAILFLFIPSACARPLPVKIHPEYSGVAPQAKKIVDEYLWLSSQNHIEFSEEVTVGFKDINHGNVVGICNYGWNWREIDIDVNYWNSSTNTTRTALLFHELTHCYCDRDHDYGKKQRYPETARARMKRALKWLTEGGPRPGYWDDGCPVSLMYPIVVDDDCMQHHYDQYIKEMFDRCSPF